MGGEELVVVASFPRFGAGKKRQSDFEVGVTWEDVEAIIKKFCEAGKPKALTLQEARLWSLSKIATRASIGSMPSLICCRHRSAPVRASARFTAVNEPRPRFRTLPLAPVTVRPVA
jgi:hypothetical protein